LRAAVPDALRYDIAAKDQFEMCVAYIYDVVSASPYSNNPPRKQKIIDDDRHSLIQNLSKL